jgi:hypothetical protein
MPNMGFERNPFLKVSKGCKTFYFEKTSQK